MNRRTFTIPNISCGHCVNAIRQELEAVSGVSRVEGDPSAKQITVEFDDSLPTGTILDLLTEIGYPAQT
jgi:copper chaperone CopZ